MRGGRLRRAWVIRFKSPPLTFISHVLCGTGWGGDGGGSDTDERWDKFLARISDLLLPSSFAFPKDRQEEANLTDQ